MSWIGLHETRENDPHVTLAWWPTTNHFNSVLGSTLGDACLTMAALGKVEAAVIGTDEFGPRKDVIVALLDPAPFQGYIDLAAPFNLSSFAGVVPHVTAGWIGRNSFTFKWLILHNGKNTYRWELT